MKRVLFLILVPFTLFCLSKSEERRALFQERTRQKQISLKMPPQDHLNGFFIGGHIAGGSLASVDTNFSYEQNGTVLVDSHYTAKEPFSLAWDISVGWMFWGYAFVDIAYRSSELPFSVFNNPVEVPSSESINPQKGFGDIEMQKALFEASLILPKLFGMNEPFFSPFIGGGLGYVHKKLSGFSQYDLSSTIAESRNRENVEGGLVYELFAGIFFLIQEHVLVDARYTYSFMGSIKPKKNFERIFQNDSIELDYTSLPRIKLRSGVLQFGITFVI